MTLAEYLTWKQINDADFAEIMGVDRSAVFRWRSGKRIPSRHAMSKIFHETGGLVRADDFFSLSTTSRNASR